MIQDGAEHLWSQFKGMLDLLMFVTFFGTLSVHLVVLLHFTFTQTLFKLTGGQRKSNYVRKWKMLENQKYVNTSEQNIQNTAFHIYTFFVACFCPSTEYQRITFCLT